MNELGMANDGGKQRRSRCEGDVRKYGKCWRARVSADGKRKYVLAPRSRL